MNWFNVDKKGLSEIVARKGKSFVLFELIQNALDCDGTRRVTASLEPVPGRPLAELLVTDDDPKGFADLSHAYTLFASSHKKSDPEKRGRFNLGEKLVLALCEEAEIVSTTGGVRFDAEGRHSTRRRTKAGSEFRATVKMTREELDEVVASSLSIIPRLGVEVIINGNALPQWKPEKVVAADLITEVAGGDGVVEPEVLRRVMRKCSVAIFSTENTTGTGGGWLYEMGIPVCETGDKWHVDVGQKVPLNLDRDGVPDSYMKTIRTLVVNAMHAELTPEDATKPWVQAALEDRRIEPDAVRSVIAQQHGKDAVAFDPSDVEGTYISQAKGSTVVSGGSYSKEAWENIRRAEALPPAGQITPSKPKDFADTEFLPESEITPAMRRFRTVVDILLRGALDAMTQEFTIIFLRSPGASTIADWNSTTYGATIRFNVSKLGEKWFEGPMRWEHIDLIVHELAHHGGHHLASGYHELMSKAAGKLVMLALARPGYFDLSVRS
jgi:hypothetical protein